jgi:5-methylcytosine-specific restriction endonuclease McrA
MLNGSCQRATRMLLKLVARSERRNRRRQHYWDVLKSDRWRQLPASVIAETGGRCEACGYLGRNRLQLHHRHYRTLGRETRIDVELLCAWCHKEADAMRASNVKARRLIRRLLPMPFRLFIN